MERRDSPPKESQPQRWKYGELTQKDIVEAGLRLTRRSGFANLSMRKLAVELSLSSMNIYYYVKDKHHVLDLIGDAVLGEVTIPPEDLSWDHRLAALFEDGREVLLRYPGVAQHLLRRRTLGLPNETRLYEVSTEILTTAGFSQTMTDQIPRIFTYLLFGAVTSELATIEAMDDPATRRFSDDREVFSVGLRLIIKGMQQEELDCSDGSSQH